MNPTNNVNYVVVVKTPLERLRSVPSLLSTPLTPPSASAILSPGLAAPPASQPAPPTNTIGNGDQSGQVKWQDPVWVGLQFSIPDPHLYMPHYTSKGVTSAATFVASATGDLDCNKKVASFTRNGAIDGNGDVSGSRAPIIVNELE